jgi:hypothetical protein
MNEKIKELARQSTGASTIYMLEEEWLKFAELIVLECAKIADEGCGSACFGLGINGAMLKEHFGVEE